jgi:hypothetical protein
MQQLKLFAPTYYASLFPDDVAAERKPEFGDPHVPILAASAEGARLILGSHDFYCSEKPDIQVERHPNGWMIFLMPCAGCDACGYIYFHDDGRTFLRRERGADPANALQIIPPGDPVPGFDSSPGAPTSGRMHSRNDKEDNPSSPLERLGDVGRAISNGLREIYRITADSDIDLGEMEEIMGKHLAVAERVQKKRRAK